MNLRSLLLIAVSISLASPLWADQGVSIPINYNLPRDGQISLLLTGESGRVVRELLHAAPRKGGPNHETWDGLDDAGHPVPAGRYTWKLLSTQGLHAEYLLTLGTNPALPWESWPGNHSGVTAVTADATGTYFVCASGENTPLLVKQTADGRKRLWEVPHWLDAWSGGIALDSAGGKVWMFSGAAVWRIDAETGKPEVRFDVRWDGKDDASPAPLDWASHNTDLAARAVAGQDPQIVVSYSGHDAVRWFDKDGKKVDEAAVPAPLGVTLAPDGRVLVISNDTVVELTRADKLPRLLIGQGLKGAYRLTVDARSGDILVAERGKEPWGHTLSTQQVKRFSRDGKFLRAYGTEGGREWNGAYDPKGFAALCDVASDGDGGFYIVEDTAAPRRCAHFDGDGNLLREWYGGQFYANFGAVDPASPADVWMDSQWGALIHARADYVHKIWTVAECYNFGLTADGLIENTAHGALRWLPRRHNGRLYLVREGRPCVVRVDPEHRRLLPMVAAVPNIVVPWNRDPWGGAPQWLRDMLGNDVKTPIKSYFWTDLNGDGKPQKEEMNFSTGTASSGSMYPDADFNYYASVYDFSVKKTYVYEWPVLNWSADGVPHYAAWDKGVKVFEVPEDAGQPNVWHAEDGSFFGSADTNANKAFGVGWWGARAGGNRVSKFDRDGKSLWVVGSHAPASVARPGEAKYFWRNIGTAHGCFAVGDVENSMIHVWDQDGLYVGRFLDNPDLNAAPAEAYVLSGENFGGSLYEDPKSGDVVFYGGGANNTPVYRIRGWDQFERQTGTVSLSDAQSKALVEKSVFEATRTDVLRIGSLGDVKPDGDLSEWKNLTPIEIKDGDTTRARVWVALTKDSLCAAWDVNTTTPWKTSAPPSLSFQGGASVAISLGPWDPERKEAAPGDMRLVVAPLEGKDKDHVSMFMPKVPLDAPNARGAGPIYKTGNGSLQLERFGSGWYSGVKMKPDGSGYTVEMKVAKWWLLVPFYPGQKLRFDASVELADPTGTKTIARIPWHSRDAADMATDDVFYEATLRPRNWGEARVGE